MTLLRIAAAALVALLVGRVVGGLREAKAVPEEMEPIEDSNGDPEQSLTEKISSTFKVGFGEVVDHTAPWIVVGLAVAALAQPFLSTGWLNRIPYLLEVPLFALLGLPVYVCASGATPFVAVLLFSGISPGAALAFLLTGPATNVTTFGLLGQLHGRRLAIVFSSAMIGASVAIGYVVNALFPTAGASPLAEIVQEEPSTFQLICLFLLAFVYLFSLARRGARKFVAEIFFSSQRALDLHPHYPKQH